MSVKKHVFGSSTERVNYYKLSEKWSSKCKIYHNLPFLNIFEPDKSIKQNSYKFSYLKKTSIDYIICNDKDEPILCIEFDGLNQGFSYGRYYFSRGNPNEERKNRMELKLQIANDSFLPFIIVGSHEFKDISPDISLNIIDGIIGEIISQHLFKDEYFRASLYKYYEQDYFKETGLSWNHYFERYGDVYIDEEGEVFDIDVDNACKELLSDVKAYARKKINLKINPISIKLKELKEYLGLYDVNSKNDERHKDHLITHGLLIDMITEELTIDRLEYKYYCERCCFEFGEDPNHAIRDNTYNSQRVRCSIKTKNFGVIESVVESPNFNSIYFNISSILTKVSEIVTLDKIRRLVAREKFSNTF